MKANSDSTKLLQEGQVIRQTYEVERFLGEGAFAEVYRVKHRFLGRQALKVFKLRGITRREAEEMLGEAIILSRIGHPNIVRVFDAGVVETSLGETAFFTMEYVAGGSLEDFWKSFGAAFMPVDTVIELMRQVCRGLCVAHGEKPPIVHRDIKPQNILVGYDSAGLRARVSDFGLAKRVNPLTLQVTALGTRVFKAPEVFQNPKADSCRGDVWALGCVLYLLLTDRLPAAGARGEDATESVASAPPLVAAGTINPAVDAALDAILRRALAFEPDARYADARELLTDLEAWRPSPARPTKQEKSTPTGDESKSVLGGPIHADARLARRLVVEALAQAKLPGKLMEAADLMEEALVKDPALRRRHEYRLSLWRKGVVM